MLSSCRSPIDGSIVYPSSFTVEDFSLQHSKCGTKEFDIFRIAFIYWIPPLNSMFCSMNRQKAFDGNIFRVKKLLSHESSGTEIVIRFYSWWNAMNGKRPVEWRISLPRMRRAVRNFHEFRFRQAFCCEKFHPRPIIIGFMVDMEWKFLSANIRGGWGWGVVKCLKHILIWCMNGSFFLLGTELKPNNLLLSCQSRAWQT